MPSQQRVEKVRLRLQRDLAAEIAARGGAETRKQRAHSTARINELERRLAALDNGNDPLRPEQKVAVDVAKRLGRLVESLEEAGHAPEATADFVLRCAFTMCAVDAGALPERAVELAIRTGALQSLWLAMIAVMGVPRRGVFESPTVPTLDESLEDQLVELSRCDWSSVELSVFGSLVEGALTPDARRKLGAHFTPREYVERLVVPTVMEPLRDEWYIVKGCARIQCDEQNKCGVTFDPKAARESVLRFHAKLCETRVLDPACGSGNFLYVAMELLQELEDEVLDELKRLGAERPSQRVNPGQFLGIEINPRAANIAELVLHLGHLRRRFAA